MSITRPGSFEQHRDNFNKLKEKLMEEGEKSLEEIHAAELNQLGPIARRIRKKELEDAREAESKAVQKMAREDSEITSDTNHKRLWGR